MFLLTDPRICIQLLNIFQKNYDLLLAIFNPEGWLEITYSLLIAYFKILFLHLVLFIMNAMCSSNLKQVCWWISSGWKGWQGEYICTREGRFIRWLTKLQRNFRAHNGNLRMRSARYSKKDSRHIRRHTHLVTYRCWSPIDLTICFSFPYKASLSIFWQA